MRGLRALLDSLSSENVRAARDAFASAWGESEPASKDGVQLATALLCAYPALKTRILARPLEVTALARGIRNARDAATYRKALEALIADRVPSPYPLPQAGEEAGEAGEAKSFAVRSRLRTFAAREKLRIAARELLPGPGGDIEVTARELSDLADVCIDAALSEALAWADARYGVPRTAARYGVPHTESGERCKVAVFGMGKLGGRELNAGSDVDLIVFYESDDGDAKPPDGGSPVTLHEYFVRVVQRLVATLDDVTEDGIVWRVDMRLRPEGSVGPLVNALAAAERYYETWGRTWERAAWIKGRALAGDPAFGDEVQRALSPFVWRRAVDPSIAPSMRDLLLRTRLERGDEAERDIKIGPGGIRDIEFFVQSLQLIWGGREPRLRSPNTLAALRDLRAHGYVTDREERELADAYVALRRLEHRIQFATGLQTHALPKPEELVDTISRTLGFGDTAALHAALSHVRETVSSRVSSLTGEDGTSAALPQRGQHKAASAATCELDLAPLFVALDAANEDAALAWMTERAGAFVGADTGRHLLALARRPDWPLGIVVRERFPTFPCVLMQAIADSANPEQAARLMASFFSRFRQPIVFAKLFAQDERALRKLVTLFGASTFLGEALVSHPELIDGALFVRSTPTIATARAEVEQQIHALSGDLEDPSTQVGALRRAKARVTMQVGLADLGEELTTRESTLVLSELADASVSRTLSFARRVAAPAAQIQCATAQIHPAMAVIAMGKLGGREIGYGADLDLFFVFDAEDNVEASESCARLAQRVLRWLSMPHDDGPGYELDTRLRPSGSHGLLVVSIGAFARYHGLDDDSPFEHAQDWERQALVKARFCAGDPELGARVLAIAHQAAYERGAPDPNRVHHLRWRMQRELTNERTGGPLFSGAGARYDMKLGRGGLVDIEFAVQWLQMKNGSDERVRTTDTEEALAALESCGYVGAGPARVLREGYKFLRKLEQRVRVLHGRSASLIEAGAPGMTPLARAMGIRGTQRQSAGELLLEQYVGTTGEIRATYLAILGLNEGGPGA